MVSKELMKIAIIGTGYVGLVTGIALAIRRHQVICVDTDQEKVAKVNAGKSPFHEPGIDEYLKKVLRQNMLHATTNFEDAVLESDMTIIAVGTPTTNNKIDLSFIKQATKQIGKALAKTRKYHVVAVKSTVLPGVTEEVVKPILEKYSKKSVGNFGLCMNPEFLREGNALEDALHPDRIVIGQIDTKSGKEFAKAYENVLAPKIFTNLQTAEMTKYAANTLLATLISYSNEIARISENTGNIDVVDVWKGVHLDKRLNPIIRNTRIKPGILSYIFSGCGFGGSCFPKDVQALASFATELGMEPKLIKSVIDINQTQPHRLISLLKSALGDNLSGKKVAILGLSFKPNTDDTRESPAFTVIEKLLLEDTKVTCHDPMAYQKNNVPQRLADLPIVLANTAKEAIQNTDAAIVITSWEEYIKLTPQFFKNHMKNPIVIDGRRIYDKHLFQNAGIIYKGIGLS